MRCGAANRITPAAKPQISGFRAGGEALVAAVAGFIFNWAFLLSVSAHFLEGLIADSVNYHRQSLLL
jgi:biotin transporter BioY